LASLNRIPSISSFGKTDLRILTVTVLHDILQKDTIPGIIETVPNRAVKAQRIMCIFSFIKIIKFGSKDNTLFSNETKKLAKNEKYF
jgi:hypothetical protein